MKYPDEDTILLKKWERGDLEAFNSLYKKYAKPLYNFIDRLIANGPTDDIFQEVFRKLLTKSKDFRGESKFSTWLFQIARHMCIDNLRKAKTHKEVSMEGLDSEYYLMREHEDLTESLEKREIKELLRKALRNLKYEYREALMTKYYGRLSYEEIAKIFNCPVGTIKSRIYYAVESFKKSMAKYI